MYIYGYDEVNQTPRKVRVTPTGELKVDTELSVDNLQVRLEGEYQGGEALTVSTTVIREYIEPTPRRGGVLVA